MKKKILFSILLIVGMLSVGIYTVNAEGGTSGPAGASRWGEIIANEGPGLKYTIEGVDLKFYQVENQTSEDLSSTVINKILKETISLSQTDYIVSPTYVRGLKDDDTVDNATYIDINLNLTKAQIGSIAYTEFTKTDSPLDPTKKYWIEVVLKYKWNQVPSGYTNYYGTNLLSNVNDTLYNVGFSEDEGYVERTLQTLNVDGTSTNEQVINVAFYVDDEDTEATGGSYTDITSLSESYGKTFNYYTTLNSENTYAQMYNYAIFTNNTYDVFDNYIGGLSMLDENDTVVLFHDVDNIDYIIQERLSAYQGEDDLEEELEEDAEEILGTEVVETPNTSLNASTLLIALSIILVISGCGIIGVVLKQKRQMQE